MANKAQTLGIPLGSGYESSLGGEAADFGFLQASDGKKCARKLFLAQLAQKIGLVLAGIKASTKVVHAVGSLVHTGVVTRGDEVGSERTRSVQKKVKLDFAVAQHVGIRRASGLVLGEHIVDDALLVLHRQIKNLERNPQLLCNEQRVVRVLNPRAFVFEGWRGVVPVAHKNADDLVARLLHEQRCH